MIAYAMKGPSQMGQAVRYDDDLTESPGWVEELLGLGAKVDWRDEVSCRLRSRSSSTAPGYRPTCGLGLVWPAFDCRKLLPERCCRRSSASLT